MKKILLLIIASICIFSCQKAPEFILFGPMNIDLPVDGGKASVSFISNRDWKATSSDSWVTISPSSGTAQEGTISVTILGSANSTYDERSATVTLTSEGMSQSISVKQAQNDGLIVDKTNYDVPYEGGDIDIAVKSNVEYEVSINNAKWIHHIDTKALNNSSIHLSVDKNMRSEGRVGNIIIKQKNGELSVTVEVLQERRIPVSSIKINRSGLSLKEGETFSLTASVEPDNASEKAVAWSSSNTSIAVVENGIVTALKEGVVTIQAETIDCSASCKVVVSNSANNIIYYTTANGEPLYFNGNPTDFGAYFVFSDYYEGQGKMVFNRDVTGIGINAFSYSDYLSSITIPESVTAIKDGSFSECKALRFVTLPPNVTEIGHEAFEGCTNLTAISLLGRVTTIGVGAFADCSSLTSINLPEGLTSIGDKAFAGCTNLHAIALPEGLTETGNRVFQGCPGLVTINLPKSLTSIGDGAFIDCTGLTSISFPDSLSAVGMHAFGGCTGLTSIILPESITYLGSNVFSDCTSLKSVLLPKGLTSISDYSFDGCISLSSIIIPETVTTIGKGAFNGCSNLTSITFQEGLITIKDNAFHLCSGLISISIPATVTTIQSYAFYDCSGLTSITINSPIPPHYNGVDVFKGSSCPIYVPSGSLARYKAAWTRIADRIQAIPE
ncbi:MAG: leucine-rich repeat protein [Bacteroidales bacterium]|nr:leucine-rich repeat protein [Bacteroidales bacterium]